MDHLSVMYTFFWGGFIILNRAEFKLQVTNLYLFFSLQEALEVLRCSPRETNLLVCRIPSEIAEKMGIHPPESPTSANSSHSNWLSPVLTLSTLGVSYQ